MGKVGSGGAGVGPGICGGGRWVGVFACLSELVYFTCSLLDVCPKVPSTTMSRFDSFGKPTNGKSN